MNKPEMLRHLMAGTSRLANGVTVAAALGGVTVAAALGGATGGLQSAKAAPHDLVCIAAPAPTAPDVAETLSIGAANPVDETVTETDSSGPVELASTDAAIDDIAALCQTLHAANTGQARTENTGSVSLSGLAGATSNGFSATDEAGAAAQAETDIFAAIRQFSRSGTGFSIAHLANSGRIVTRLETGASAVAGAVDDRALSLASAGGQSVYGVEQAAQSVSGNSSAVADNSGRIEISGGAVAGAAALGNTTPAPLVIDTVAESQAALSDVQALRQSAGSDTGDSSAVITNSGDLILTVAVSGRSTAGPPLSVVQTSVFAEEIAGIRQFSISSDGASRADIVNDGAITIDVSGEGSSASTGEVAAASVAAESEFIHGIRQFARSAEATGSIRNSGVITVEASLNAFAQTVADGDTTVTVAESLAAEIFGIDQIIEGDNASANTVNSGQVTVSGQSVSATESRTTAETDSADPGMAGAFASADSHALGISQEAMGDDVSITGRNTGALSVQASASASATNRADAVAEATGASQWIGRGTGRIFNDGVIRTSASADASTSAPDGISVAEARAEGVLMSGDTFGGGTAIENTGTIVSSAAAAGGSATAHGILLESDRFTGVIANRGSGAAVVVHAVGNDANATVIGFSDDTEIVDGVTIINDSGAITATRSTTSGQAAGGGAAGGGADQRGVAISLIDSRGNPIAGAPATIALRGSDGPGSILGNINIRPQDRIEVTNGVTRISGVVNNPVRRGTMVIGDGGTLLLPLDDRFGVSEINVDRFEQAPDATVVFEVGPVTSGRIAAGPSGNTIAAINANTVSLDGAVELRMRPGLYSDGVTFENVITATGDISGTWSSITLPSPLLRLDGITATGSGATRTGEGRSDQSISFSINRVPFGAITGLTPNQRAAGNGIEGAYAVLAAGQYADSPFRAMVENFFSLNGDEYQSILETLHGSRHAEGLASVSSSLDLLGLAVDARLAGNPAVAAPMSEGRPDQAARTGPSGRPGPQTALWVAPHGSWGDRGGDINAPGSHQRLTGVHVGVDHQFTPSLRGGIVGGHYTADIDFRGSHFGGRFGGRFGDSGSSFAYSGSQIGIFGQVDHQNAYARAVAGFGSYRGASARMVDTGLSTGVLNGAFDAGAWSLSVEAGRRFDLAASTSITPFAGLSYTAGRIGAFTERDANTGVALRVSGDHDTVRSELGIRAEQSIDSGVGNSGVGDIRVTGQLSWIRDASDAPPTVDASFAAVPGSGFTVRGVERSEDAASLDLALSWNTGFNMEISAAYSGHFSADTTDHGLSAEATVRF